MFENNQFHNIEILLHVISVNVPSIKKLAEIFTTFLVSRC